VADLRKGPFLNIFDVNLGKIQYPPPPKKKKF